MANKELFNYMKVLQRNEKKGGDIYAEVREKKKKGKKQKYASDKSIYEVTLTNYILHLYQLIFIINDIDETNYMIVDRYSAHVVKDVKIDKKFKEASILDWENPADINSATYRGRFATLFLIKMVRRAHRTVKKVVDKVSKGNHKYEAYNQVLNKLIYSIDLFITGFLSSDIDYTWAIQTLMEIFILADGDDPTVVLRLEEVRELLKENVTDKSFDDGILVNNIMKMAYALATDSAKVKKTPKYVENFPLKNETLKATQIGKLGFAIYNRWQKDKSRNILYEIFMKANPLIYSNIPSVNENPEIGLGTQALTFLKVCVDDPSVSRYINRLIQA